MLEQNTDRLLAVVGALAVGALVIALVPGMGEIFSTVIDTIKEKVTTGMG